MQVTGVPPPGPTAPPPGPAVRMATPQGRWVLGATIAGSSLALLDGTVVNVALARIGEDLDAGFTTLQWVTNAYTLTLAALILLGGVLGDRYGRRRVFQVGVVWFALASALCAFAPDAGTLVAARALQGVGAALLTPGSLAILAASFAPEDRSRAVGAWSGLGGIATAIGPFLGGWLVGIDWRLVFLINLPVAAGILLVSAKHVPETRGGDVPRRLDVTGVVLIALSLAALTWGLTEVGAAGWSPPVVVALVAGLVAGAAFVVVERRTDHPLVPLSMLAERTFAGLNVATVLVYAALSVFFFLLVLQLQVVGGWSPLAAGTSLLPVTALMLLLSARFGGLAQRTGARPLMTAGCVVAALGFAAATRIGPDPAYLTDVLPAVALLGLGLSMTVAPLTAAVLAAAPERLSGTASGINNAVARTAGLLAVAVVPAVAGLAGDASGGAFDASRFDGGYDVAMLIGAGLLVAGAVVSFLLPHPHLGRRRDHDRTAERRACPVSAPALHPPDAP